MDGTCIYGYTELMPENVLVLELWGDLQAIGDRAWDLHNIELDEYDAGEILVKLRVLAGERAAIERARAEAANRGGK